MSQTVTCDRCGRPKDIPAFEGDGVYTTHHCVIRCTACGHTDEDVHGGCNCLCHAVKAGRP